MNQKTSSKIPENIFRERLKILPSKLIYALVNPPFNRVLLSIFSLAAIKTPEEKSTIIECINAVLLLMIPKEKFKEELIKNTKLTLGQIEIIDRIVQSQIFEPLKPELDKYQYLLEKEIIQMKAEEKKEVNLEISKIPSINFPKTTKAQIEKHPEQDISHSFPTASELSSEKHQPSATINLPDIQIPEPIDIKVEKSIQQNTNVTPINIPEVSPEKQAEIKNTLTQLMTSKKTEAPKIVEEMGKIEKTPPSQPQKQESKKEKATAEISQTSKVITGKNNNFVKEQMPSSTDQDKSSIFEIKIKEAKEKKEELPEVHQPISYKKYHPEKPFGET